MSFAKKFQPQKKKDANRRIEVYLTACGNQCERYEYTGLKIPDHSIIRARSIKSFFEEIRAGDELRDYTPLHYKTDETNIEFKNTRILSDFSKHISIHSISTEDAKEFTTHNNNTIRGLTIPNNLNTSLEGYLLIFQDPSITQLELLSNSLDNGKLISKGIFLHKLNIASINYINNIATYNLTRLDSLKILTISNVTLTSKVAEMNFFRNFQFLPNLNTFLYSHSHRHNNTKINFKCILKTDYSYTNTSSLLNLWKPKREVDCSLNLSGRFTKIFCRYSLSKVFSNMKALYELGMFWNFFKEDEYFASKSVTRNDLSKRLRLRRPLNLLQRAPGRNLNANNFRPHPSNQPYNPNPNTLLNVMPRPANINILVPPPAPLNRRIGIRRRFPSSISSSSSSEFSDLDVEGNNFFENN